MKTLRAYTGIFSSKNDDLKFLKTAKKKQHKMHMHYVHNISRACVTVLSLQANLSLTRNMNVTVAKELYYIFSEISKF